MTMAAANARSPEEQIEVITTSLRCFQLSLIELIPVLGIPFSLMVIVKASRLRSRLRKAWNPANHYLNWGMTLGCIGVFTFLLAALLLYAGIATGFDF